MNRPTLIALAALAAPGFALAQPAATPPAQPAAAAPGTQGAAKAVEDDKKLVCRMEVPTGSIRRQRICKTQEQLAREREEAKRYMDAKMQNYGNMFGPGFSR